MATPIFDASIYGKYFTAQDPNVLAWAENILQKLYSLGIVPKYITRQESTLIIDAPDEDNDYIEFWRPLTIFWGYAVQLARVFENFTGNRDLLREHLLQRGYYPNNDQSLDKLVYMLENALRIRRQRGSTAMYQIGDTGDSDSDSGGGESDSDGGHPYLDGELLKLIAYRKNNFFQLGLPLTKYVGWNINNCSPIYTGLTKRYDLNLGYEWTEDVVSLLAYPLLNPQDCSIVADNTDDDSDSDSGSDSLSSNFDIDIVRTTMQVSPVAHTSGIGDVNISKMVTIDPQLNFEITFQVRQLSLTNTFTFGCLCFDQSNNQINLSSIVTGAPTNFFFSNRKLNRNDKFYFIRGIIYNSSASNLSATDGQLNIGFGNQLKFPSNAVKIIPYIVSSSSVLHIWNLKINVCSLKYSNALLNTSRHIDLFIKNNNDNLSRAQLYTILRKCFMPYNTSFSITHLGL